MLTEAFSDLAETTRSGTRILDGMGAINPEHPVWVEFAHGMAPLMTLPARMMAGLLDFKPDRETKVLDISHN